MRILILLVLVGLVMGSPFHWDDCEEICDECTYNAPKGCWACEDCRRANII